MYRIRSFVTAATLAAAVFLTLFSTQAFAHCDTMEGPTVVDGQAALTQGDLTPALKWIAAKDEEELRSVFTHAVSVRGESEKARELADRYFLETLVRLHRANEGAPYTGIKPIGYAIEPIIEEADAILAGANKPLIEELVKSLEASIRVRLESARKAYAHKDHNVEAGRHFVAQYVEFMHYVEHLAKVAEGHSGEHEAESSGAAHQHE